MANRDNREFANWLRLKRLERSVNEGRAISMGEIAQDAGISRQYMAFLEQGRSRPTREVALRLARALRASDTEVLEKLGYLSIPPRIAPLIRRLERLSDAELHRAEQLIAAAFPGEEHERVTLTLATA